LEREHRVQRTQVVRLFDVSLNATVGIYPTVELGDVLSKQAIDSQFQHPVAPVTVGSGEFYLGIALVSRGFDAADVDTFGWMRLRPEHGVLTMVENVMAYRTEGIVVGTTRVVPEPATAPLVAAVVAGSWRRKRKFSQCRHW
jgi:hypothetical protein